MFQTKREMQIKIDDQSEEISRLKEEINGLKDALTSLEGVGRCVSNMCLDCKYALTIGEKYNRRPYACLKNLTCQDYSPV